MKKIILSLALVVLAAGTQTACTRQTAQQKKTKAFHRQHRAGQSMPCPKKDC